MLGAHVVMPCWTATATMPACALLGERGLSDTTRFGTSSMIDGGLHLEWEGPRMLVPITPEDVSNNASGRRPPDVYLPAFAGTTIACDFAITAPQRQESLVLASRQTDAATKAYARQKRTSSSDVCRLRGSKIEICSYVAAPGMPRP